MSQELTPAAAALSYETLRQLSRDEQSALLTMTDAWTQQSRIVQPYGVLPLLERKGLAERRERPPSAAYPKPELWWRLTRAGTILSRLLAGRAEAEARREAFDALSPDERARLRAQAQRRALLERRA